MRAPSVSKLVLKCLESASIPVEFISTNLQRQLKDDDKLVMQFSAAGSISRTVYRQSSQARDPPPIVQSLDS